ncbi:MAG: YraN family protein [Synechococcus sp.]
MTSQRGAEAEARVRRLLQTRGWLVLDQNWTCRWGELDLVLVKAERLLVVEVKGRRSPAWALRAVGPLKRRRIARSIDCWRAEHPDRGATLLEVKVAVVPLRPAVGPVRWIGLEQLC